METRGYFFTISRQTETLPSIQLSSWWSYISAINSCQPYPVFAVHSAVNQRCCSNNAWSKSIQVIIFIFLILQPVRLLLLRVIHLFFEKQTIFPNFYFPINMGYQPLLKWKWCSPNSPNTKISAFFQHSFVQDCRYILSKHQRFPTLFKLLHMAD